MDCVDQQHNYSTGAVRPVACGMREEEAQFVQMTPARAHADRFNAPPDQNIIGLNVTMCDTR